ncbi:hypothetical protein MAPG_08815 [Magnaporthiopsis poae ATCC 64411]|uniref:Uncharacterized protein n=1 Tax=Magnaporthiopsis poae (strain ATCC 64411 / 73-15) TaxID=644358 RepID=A0A0C4E8B5_MAGP6|nr:hypothetical protein MAPG_08815 [Magnaporthiopsis poae ATCC 64411]
MSANPASLSLVSLPQRKTPLDIPDFADRASVGRWEVQNLAQDKLPITLPWGHSRRVRLGTCLHSSRLDTENPWEEKQGPFLAVNPHRPGNIVLRRDLGPVASFQSTETSSGSNTNDHLSVGFGVGVGLPFVAHVSVKGDYDQDVMKNQDADKTSMRATLRMGTVELTRPPRLTNEAITAIKCGGIAAMEEQYGDYYVAAYQLGGDSGMLISSSSHREAQKEVYGVTVKTEALFWEESVHTEMQFETFSSGCALTLYGYDTLDRKTWEQRAQGAGQAAADLYRTSQDVAGRTQFLGARLDRVVKEMDLKDGDMLSLEQCDELTRRGVVVEVVLRPVRMLREVLEHMLDDKTN